MIRLEQELNILHWGGTIAQKHPGITLAGFEWRLFLQQVWESSIQEGICISGAATEHAD